MTDAYTLHLFGMAEAECSRRRVMLWVWPPGIVCRFVAIASRMEKELMQSAHGDTLADALTALLTALGVDVPERPSAERVNLVAESLHPDTRPLIIGQLRDLYAREPLTVLALLEGTP